MTLEDDLRWLGEKYPGHFENDPGPKRDIPLETQFEDCRSIGIAPQKLREREPVFADLYEAYLKGLPSPSTSERAPQEEI